METLNIQRQLRKSFATYPTGIAFTAVITDGSPAGMLTSSFTSVSLDPPLVAVSFDKKSKTWPLIQKAENVGISVLSSQNLNSINQLKQNAVTRFKDLVYRVEAETAVLLPDATAHFVVTPEEFINAGDHVLALWRVKDHQSQANKNPLVFHGSTIKPLRK